MIAVTLVLAGCTDEAGPDTSASAFAGHRRCGGRRGAGRRRWIRARLPVRGRSGGRPHRDLGGGLRLGGNLDVVRPPARGGRVRPGLHLRPRRGGHQRSTTLLDGAGDRRADRGRAPALLQGIDEPGPFVLVGHSFGGLLVRTFGANYPDEVAGMVLIDASSEPEIPVYRRLHAGAWIDGGTKVDIDEVSDEVRHARLGDAPLVVLTAEVLEDEWLSQVPDLAARAQARLAHVVDERGAGARSRHRTFQSRTSSRPWCSRRSGRCEASARTGKDLPSAAPPSRMRVASASHRADPHAGRTQ